MSDGKFSCPHCGQHIVCDEAYCRHAIQCPGCGQTLFVPPLAAFASSTGGHLKLEIPVGSKSVFKPQVPTLGILSEGEWNQQFMERTGELPRALSSFWLFLMAPFPLALALHTFAGARLGGIIACFLLTSLVAGFVWAGRCHKTGFQFAVFGLLASTGMVVAYAGLGLAIFFAGCVLL